MPNEKKEQEVTSPPDQFVGRDVLESYKKNCNYKPVDSFDRYFTLTQLITDGMELLPDFDNPDEKDEEQKKKNKVKQDEKDELYTKAGKVLKTEIPHKRQLKDKYLDKENRVYELKATDADNYEVGKNDLEIGLNDFNNQQYEQHTSKLQEAHNQIYHIVTHTDIYPLKKPSFEEMVEDLIKEDMKNMLEKTEPEEEITEEETDGNNP